MRPFGTDINGQQQGKQVCSPKTSGPRRANLQIVHQMNSFDLRKCREKRNITAGGVLGYLGGLLLRLADLHKKCAAVSIARCCPFCATIVYIRCRVGKVASMAAAAAVVIRTRTKEVTYNYLTPLRPRELSPTAAGVSHLDDTKRNGHNRWAPEEKAKKKKKPHRSAH